MQCCRGEWGFMPSDILKSVQKNKFTPSFASALSILHCSITVHNIRWHLLVQNQLCKQKDVKDLFKGSIKDTRTTSMMSFWCLYCKLWTIFAYCSDFSIINLEEVNASCDIINIILNTLVSKAYYEGLSLIKSRNPLKT